MFDFKSLPIIISKKKLVLVSPVEIVEIIVYNDTVENLIETKKNVQVKIVSVLEMLESITDYKQNSKDVRGILIGDTSVSSPLKISYYVSAFSEADEKNLFLNFNGRTIYYTKRESLIEDFSNEESVVKIIERINKKLPEHIEAAKRLEKKQ